jgi:dynein heavy chain
LETKAVLHNEAVSQVQTLLALLEAVMLTIAPQPEARTALAYERQFLYCLAWSIGGLLDPADRRLFDTHLKSFKREALPQVSSSNSRLTDSSIECKCHLNLPPLVFHSPPSFV